MSNLICITNRKLCKTNFLAQVEKIAQTKPMAIVLREKDLIESDYLTLAKSVKDITTKYNVPLVLHNFTSVAKELGVKNIHIPLHLLQTIDKQELEYFTNIGTSCHSVEDAILATKLCCTYAFAGHIFTTDCKKGLAPRGLNFLKAVVKSTTLPIFAIGGINKDNYPLTLQNGAKGCCIMSGFMQAENVEEYIKQFN